MRAFLNETDVPTKQNQETADLRISQENENQRRAKDSQSTPSHWLQGPERVSSSSLKFPKSARMRKRGEFREFMQSNRIISGEWIHMRHRSTSASDPKLGIAVPKRFGHAPLRNRFKRVVRAAFCATRAHLHHLELYISPRKSPMGITLQSVVEDLKKLW